jgi:hypothetical protein
MNMHLLPNDSLSNLDEDIFHDAFDTAASMDKDAEAAVLAARCNALVDEVTVSSSEEHEDQERVFWVQMLGYCSNHCIVKPQQA